MYAVIASGGKQFKVKLGSVIKTEKLEVEPTAKIEFDKVLLVADGENIQIGTPYLTEKVCGEVLTHGRHKKIGIIKFHRRKHHMKQMGHRQDYTEIKITKIGKEEFKPKAKKETTEKKEEKPSNKTEEK